MKASVVVGYNDIEYIDIPEPEMQSGQVKVEVWCCGICGSDIPRVLKGACHSFPQVLGHEFSGVVIEVANDVTTVKVGDHVVGVPLVPCHECDDCQRGNYSLCKHYSFIGSRQQGAMAERVVLPASNVYKIESCIPMHLAALFEPSTVALHGILINDFHPSDKDSVLVIGAGTIALFTLQWCKILGAKHVTVIIRNKGREAIVRKYGADYVLSSLDEGYEQSALSLTNGHGYDYVLDAAGTNDTIKASMCLAANKSHVCLIGTPTKPVEFTVKEWEMINRREMHITGSWMSYSSPWPGKEWELTAECMANGRLKMDEDMIYKHYPLSKVRDAFIEFEKNATAIKGRIMLDIKE
jgi:L-iditol 2-dehydrogenase